MQLHLQLVTFEYEEKLPFRTVTIDGEPWFYAIDICTALGIANSRNAVARLDEDDVRTADGVDSLKRRVKMTIVNESGLYNLTFESRKAEAKKFKRWVTREVLPQIRKGGSYTQPGAKPSGLPVFVRRFNDNWNRVEAGHFSVISELFIRVYGKFEQAGHRIAEHGPDGKELRPDVSVGKTFPKWLELQFPHLKEEYKKYKHLLPDGTEVEARQYKLIVLPAFVEFIETIWLPHHAYGYLESRDVTALQYLPKLLTAPQNGPTAKMATG